MYINTWRVSQIFDWKQFARHSFFLFGLACSRLSDGGERVKSCAASVIRGTRGKKTRGDRAQLIFCPLPTIWTPGTGYNIFEGIRLSPQTSKTSESKASLSLAKGWTITEIRRQFCADLLSAHRCPSIKLKKDAYYCVYINTWRVSQIFDWKQFARHSFFLFGLACSRLSDGGERVKSCAASVIRGTRGKKTRGDRAQLIFCPLPTIWTPGTGYNIFEGIRLSPQTSKTSESKASLSLAKGWTITEIRRQFCADLLSAHRCPSIKLKKD